jgi:hypothetical protein
LQRGVRETRCAAGQPAELDDPVDHFAEGRSEIGAGSKQL